MVTVRSLESVHSPRYFRFCNVLHGQSGPSPLIESTDSMISAALIIISAKIEW